MTWNLRLLGTALVAALWFPAASSAQPAAPSPAAVERAQQLLAETHKAMGAKLSSVSSIVATGRTRRVRRV